MQQTVSLLAANSQAKQWRTQLPRTQFAEGEAITMTGYLLNAAGQQINPGPATVTLRDSSGKEAKLDMERSGNAYSLNLGRAPPVPTPTRPTVTNEGKLYTDAGNFAVSTAETELQDISADYPLLYGLSQKYGGSTLLQQNIAALADSIRANTKIKPLIIDYTERVPLIDWKWYFFLLLLVATIEWLLRKYWLAM